MNEDREKIVAESQSLLSPVLPNDPQLLTDLPWSTFARVAFGAALPLVAIHTANAQSSNCATESYSDAQLTQSIGDTADCLDCAAPVTPMDCATRDTQVDYNPIGGDGGGGGNSGDYTDYYGYC